MNSSRASREGVEREPVGYARVGRVSSYPAWTPAAAPGLVPLQPLTFGTILGRSFAALRRNPAVLLGFAVVTQIVTFLLTIGVTGAIAFWSFSRLDTLQPGSDDYMTLFYGSFAITGIAGFVLGIAGSVLGVIVQGVVILDVSRAILAEKLRLGALWRLLKPAFWRLLGYSFAIALVALTVVAGLAVALFGLGLVVLPLAIVLTILLVLAAIPLTWWISTKLVLTPSIIVLERAGIAAAIARSWRLTRGRFWPYFGVVVLISVIFGVLAQIVNIPFSFLGSILVGIISPTGDNPASGIITLVVSLVITYAVVLLVQAISVVVNASAAALMYADARMRHEALDIDLLRYVDARDAGRTDLADPWRLAIGRDGAAAFTTPAAP